MLNYCRPEDLAVSGLPMIGGLPVVVDAKLGPMEFRLEGETVRVGSLAGFQAVVDEWNRRYTIVRTSPPSLLNNLTGVIEEMPTYEVPVRVWGRRPAPRWPLGVSNT